MPLQLWFKFKGKDTWHTHIDAGSWGFFLFEFLKSSKHLKTARRCLCISQLEGKVCTSVCMSVYAQRKCDWYSDPYFKHPFKSQFQCIIVYCSHYFTNFFSCTQFLIAKITLLKLNYCNKTKPEFFLYPSGSTFKPLNPVKRLDKSRKRNRRTTIMGIPNQVQKELGMSTPSFLLNA